MRHRSKALPGILLAALLALFLGSACVRLNEPSAYRCDSDADCDSGESCSAQGLCRSDSICESDTECRDDQICNAGSCTAPQCTQPTGQCGTYACSLGRCTTYCASDSSCRPGATCSGGSCFEPGSRANDFTCTTDTICQSKHCCTNNFGIRSCQPSCLKPVGATCSLGVECASSLCCPTKGKTPLSCSAVACSELAECDSSLDCSNGRECAAGKCVEPAPVPQKTGASCSTSAQCLSAICQANTCRAATGNLCAVDVECETGHVCCPSVAGKDRLCSGGDGKCKGSVGAPCSADADCSTGRCNDGTWCTKNCNANLDCGVSPWGDDNACETNGLGKRICFAGCSSDSDCHTYLGARFYCYLAFDSTANICATN